MIAALYALVCLIWGSTWLVIKIGLVGVPPVKEPTEELQAAKDPASATGSRPAPRTLRNHRRPYEPA